MTAIPMTTPIYANMTAFEKNQAYWAAKRAPKPVSTAMAVLLSRPASVVRIALLLTLPAVAFLSSGTIAALITFKVLLALTGSLYTKAEETRRVNRFILAEVIAVPVSAVIFGALHLL